MDELDLLKQDWQKKNHSFQQLSEQEIYKMLHTKSSSIVKWILLISILEVSFWIAISFIFKADDYMSKVKFEHLKLCFAILTYFNYLVILVFIYLFYKNYINISTTSSTRTLMRNILGTRKTVQYYVWCNLVMIVISLLFGFYLAFYHNPELTGFKDELSDGNHNLLLLFSVLFLLLVIAVFLGVFWLFYRIVYGILLRKLHANYHELKKIDLE